MCLSVSHSTMFAQDLRKKGRRPNPSCPTWQDTLDVMVLPRGNMDCDGTKMRMIIYDDVALDGVSLDSAASAR